MFSAALISVAVSGWTLKCYKKYVFQVLSLYLTLKKIITFSNWFAFNQKKTFPHKGYSKILISQACTRFMLLLFWQRPKKSPLQATVTLDTWSFMIFANNWNK